MILLSAHKGWLWVQHDDEKMLLQVIDQKSFRALPSSCGESCLVDGGDPSDSPRRSSWTSPESFTSPSATGNTKFSPVLDEITSVPLSLLVWISDASIFSNSTRSATNISHFQILPAYKTDPRNNQGKTIFTNWWSLHTYSAEMVWYSNNEPNGIIGPLNGSPKLFS